MKDDDVQGGHGQLVAVLHVVVALVVLGRGQVEGLHQHVSKNGWQELVVGYVLHFCSYDPPRLLVECLLVPMRIDLFKLFRDPVVFPGQQSVQAGQPSIVIDPLITTFKASGTLSAIGIAMINGQHSSVVHA